MFMRGQHELAKGTETGAFNAIREFHDALEIFLVVIADSVGVTKRTVRFHEYPGEIKNASGIEFVLGKIVDEVNDLRTPYKHHGTRPNPKAVSEVGAALEVVFEKNSERYLEAAFNDIGLSDIPAGDASHALMELARESSVAGC